METAGRALLAVLGVILVAHYLQGGSKQLKAYANFLFTGRGPDGGTIGGAGKADTRDGSIAGGVGALLEHLQNGGTIAKDDDTSINDGVQGFLDYLERKSATPPPKAPPAAPKRPAAPKPKPTTPSKTTNTTLWA